ncbi:MAG TPA: histidine kinase dimerization/phospho-acceptor domain-containing protein, partial [Telluria sp.]
MQEPHPVGEDSECARLVARKDWGATPLGPVESWPQSLRTSLSICLACDFPILLWWGPDKVMLYNDEYIPVLGKKHPAAMGGLGHEVWADVWSVVGPMLEQVASSGRAVKAEDLLLLMNRQGYDEEAYFSFSYSPIADESGGVGGIFTPVIETTEKVIGQRRVERLRRLGSLGRADNLAQACQALADSLAGASEDLPFGLVYAIDADGAGATLAAAFGLEACPEAAPARIEADAASPMWPVLAAAHAPAMQVVDGLDRSGVALPRGTWGAAVSQALAIPVTLPGQSTATVVLVAAVSPHRVLDDVYLSFYTLLADQVHGIVSSALSNEAERKRAEALAQIDRAKTTFFSNVSHEFRTPLTLMLGPLSELDADDRLPADVRERLQLVERNGMRLLKLVNALLDFSRIEAGRMVAHFEPVDLAQYTADLAAVFRSAVERAGLRYE